LEPHPGRPWPHALPQAILAAGVLGLSALLPGLPERAARLLMGSCLALANGFALWACLARARHWPAEARSWRLMVRALAAAMAANILVALHHGTAPQSAVQDTLAIGLYGYAALAYPWAMVRLPLASRHPEGFRLHLLGGMVFGSSLALLLWILGMWQATAQLSWLDQGLLAGLCLRVALMGGVAAYQIVDEPGRLRGPLAWLTFAISLGAFPGVWAIAQKGIDTASIPFVAGLTPIFPLAVAFAALHPHPADGPEEPAGPRGRHYDWLLYLPYFGSALCLLGAIQRTSQHLLVPMIGFVAVSSLLVIHQFALLAEVRAARDGLDARVQERTRDLETAQGILLRTERMNGLALLGAGMIHDLNNALGAILPSLELIRYARQQGRLPAEADLGRIELAAQHSRELSGRVMAYARQEAQAETLVDLARVVQEETALLALLLPRRIQLLVDPGEGAFPVLAARGQLQQALVNLVGNARDAITGSGTIRIGLARGPLQDGRPGVGLEVADSGTGMEPEILARLFQPMFTTKPEGRGTGLGLASVKAITERMGGRIEVASAPGAGTAFTLSFPLQEPAS